MEYLLDTHTFLWFINGDAQLSKNAREAIGNPDAIKFISIASFWEIAIKVNLGKLSLDMPYNDLRQQVTDNGFEILPITFSHTAELISLDLHHRDPFDRIIIAQAKSERLILISKDGNFEKYDQLKLLW
jgi:PIN domain nuclease of toxin-antitoxin system